MDARHLRPLAPLAAAVALIPLLSGCGPIHVERLDIGDEEVRAIEIDNETGDIQLSVGSELEVVAERFGSAEAEFSVDADGTLHLWQRCGRGIGSCAIDWRVTVPEDLAAQLHTDAGDIEVEGSYSSLELRAGGRLSVRSVFADELVLDADYNDIDVDDSIVDVVRARTDHGQISIELRNQPRDVDLRTGVGDLFITVPAGEYVFDLSADGDIEVEYRLRENPRADSRIAARTRDGDIELFSR